jgi:hypothetical protein
MHAQGDFGYDQETQEWNDWAESIGNSTHALEGKVDALHMQCTELQNLTTPQVWSEWLHSALHTSMRVRDYVKDIVGAALVVFQEQIQQWVTKEIAVRTTDLEQIVIRQSASELMQIRGDLRGIRDGTTRDLSELGGTVRQGFARHEQKISDLQAQMPNIQSRLQSVQRLETDARVLHDLTARTQGALSELTKSLPTSRELRAALELASTRVQLEVSRDLQQGDHAERQETLNILDRLAQASEAKMEARLGALEKLLGAREDTWKQETATQARKIEELTKENQSLQLKFATTEFRTKEMVVQQVEQATKACEATFSRAPPPVSDPPLGGGEETMQVRCCLRR